MESYCPHIQDSGWARSFMGNYAYWQETETERQRDAEIFIVEDGDVEADIW